MALKYCSHPYYKIDANGWLVCSECFTPSDSKRWTQPTDSEPENPPLINKPQIKDSGGKRRQAHA